MAAEQGSAEITVKDLAALGAKLMTWARTLSSQERQTIAAILALAGSATDEDVRGHVVILGGGQLTDVASEWSSMLIGGPRVESDSRRREIIAKLNEWR